MLRKTTISAFAAIGAFTLVALAAFSLGQGVAAQDNPAPVPAPAPAPMVEASHVAFVDLDRVLEKDKTLDKALAKLRSGIELAKEDLDKNFKSNIENLTNDIRKHSVGSKGWLDTLKTRAGVGSEYIDKIDDAEVNATIDRDEAIVAAVNRAEAAIKAVAERLNIDTVIRIQTPDDDATPVQIATFKYKAQRILYFSPSTRDVTEEVLAAVNKDFKE